jgi:hypothetical protein
MAIGLGTFLVIAVAIPWVLLHVVGTERERERERQRERQRLDAIHRETLRKEQVLRDAIQRDRRVFQMADTRQTTAVQAPRRDQLGDNRPFIPPPLPKLPVMLLTYLQNARDQQRQRGAKLRRCWQVIIDGLTVRNTGTAVRYSLYLDVATLECCYELADNKIIELLISKGNSFGLKEVVDVYLQPLLYPCNFANAANPRSGDYTPLISNLRVIEIYLETLSNQIYTVRSFFGAVHAVLYRCVAPNQTLREYVEMLIHLTELLNRALRPYLLEQTEFRPKVSLLVGLSPLADSRNSRAIIGFNAVGRKEVKSYIIEERKRHLNVLDKVQSHGLPWLVGNCAESETFAHIGKLSSSSINRSHGLIVATLTLDIMDGGSNGPCRQCVELTSILRNQIPTITILSLAPVKGYIKS